MPRPRTHLSEKDRVMAALRREILAARLKVTLDKELDRKTSPTVMKLAKMKLPPVRRQHFGVTHVKSEVTHPDRTMIERAV